MKALRKESHIFYLQCYPKSHIEYIGTNNNFCLHFSNVIADICILKNSYIALFEVFSNSNYVISI